MRVSEFDFHLPESSIAQEPPKQRGTSRMLVLDRSSGRTEDRMFADFPEYLGAGDCLVLNNSKVIPARLLGRRRGGEGEVEVFLLRRLPDREETWTAMVKPGRKLRPGAIVSFDGAEAEVIAAAEYGERTLRFRCAGSFDDFLERAGHVPLPPYIKRADEAGDRDRYQTVYARHRGSVAAPTAGLHFTPEILERCRAAGASIAYVTLHVGLGTFQPLRAENVSEVKLHSEEFFIAPEDRRAMEAARRRVCAGTTSVRAIESAWRGASGETDLFISPGFEFRATGAMLTNFHLPKSSLLMLVCAFAGTEAALKAYEHAVAAGYRFYSYGDCMLIV